MGHGSTAVHAVDWSGDGTMLVSGGADKRVCAWDAQAAALAKLPLHTDQSDSSSAHVHTSAVKTLRFSPDSKHFVSCCSERLLLWDAEKLTVIAAPTADYHASKVKEPHVGAVDWHADSARFAFGFGNEVAVFRLGAAGGGGQIVEKFDDHDKWLHGVKWHPKRDWIATASEDRFVGLFIVGRGVGDPDRTRFLQGHEGPVAACAWSPDGTLLVTAGADKVLRRWDGLTGEAVGNGPLAGHTAPVAAVSISPDGSRIVSCAREILIFDTNTGIRVGAALECHDGAEVHQVAWAGEGCQLASCAEDGIVGIFNAVTDTSLGEKPLPVHGSATAGGGGGGGGGDSNAASTVVLGANSGVVVHAITFSRSGKHLASCAGDGSVCVTDALTGAFNPLASAPAAGTSVAATLVRFSPDATKLGACFDNGTVVVFESDAARGWAKGANVRQTTFVHDKKGCELSMCWSKCGELLASASDASVKVWDVDGGAKALLRTLDTDLDDDAAAGATQLAGSHPVIKFSYEEPAKFLAVCVRQQLRVWSIDGDNYEIFDKVPAYEEHDTQTLKHISFRPNGPARLVSSDGDSLIVWSMNVEGGARTLKVSAYPSILMEDVRFPEDADRNIVDVKWSPDGECIAASFGMYIQIFFVESPSADDGARHHHALGRRRSTRHHGKGKGGKKNRKKTGRSMSMIRGMFGAGLGNADGGGEGGAIMDDVVTLGATIGLCTFSSHVGCVLAFRFTKDSKRVASHAQDQSVRVWNVETGDLLQYAFVDEACEDCDTQDENIFRARERFAISNRTGMCAVAGFRPGTIRFVDLSIAAFTRGFTPLSCVLDGSFHSSGHFLLAEPEVQVQRLYDQHVDPNLLLRAGNALCSRTTAMHVAIVVFSETGEDDLYKLMFNTLQEEQEDPDNERQHDLGLFMTDYEGRTPLDLAIATNNGDFATKLCLALIDAHKTSATGWANAVSPFPLLSRRTALEDLITRDESDASKSVREEGLRNLMSLGLMTKESTRVELKDGAEADAVSTVNYLIETLPTTAARILKELGVIRAPDVTDLDLDMLRMKKDEMHVCGDETVYRSHLWWDLKYKRKVLKDDLSQLERPVVGKFVPIENFAGRFADVFDSPLAKLAVCPSLTAFDNDACRALLDWKWKTFGRRKFRKRFCIFFTGLAALSTLALLLPYIDPEGDEVKSMADLLDSSEGIASLVVSGILFFVICHHMYTEVWQFFTNFIRARHDNRDKEEAAKKDKELREAMKKKEDYEEELVGGGDKKNSTDGGGDRRQKKRGRSRSVVRVEGPDVSTRMMTTRRRLKDERHQAEMDALQSANKALRSSWLLRFLYDLLAATYAHFRNDGWNVLDLLQIAGVGTTLGMHTGFLGLAERHELTVPVASIAVFLMWLKLFAFMRAFERLGALIRMIEVIVADILPFLVILATVMVASAFVFYLLFYRYAREDGVGPRNIYAREEGEDLVFGWNAALFSQFTLMLGDFSTELLENSPYPRLVKVVFILVMLFVNIVMLNLLIAIMGDSYDKVQENAFLEYRREKARVLMEIEIMMTKKERKREDYFPRWLHVLQPTTTGGARSRDRWIGRIREIKESVEQQVVNLEHSMRDQFGQQLRKQQKEMEKSLEELKDSLHEIKGIVRHTQAHTGGGLSKRRPSVMMQSVRITTSIGTGEKKSAAPSGVVTFAEDAT